MIIHREPEHYAVEAVIHACHSAAAACELDPRRAYLHAVAAFWAGVVGIALVLDPPWYSARGMRRAKTVRIR
jgi:hypothetical protein